MLSDSELLKFSDVDSPAVVLRPSTAKETKCVSRWTPVQKRMPRAMMTWNVRACISGNNCGRKYGNLVNPIPITGGRSGNESVQT